MAKNVIYLGPITNQPQTVDRVCTGALVCGSIAYSNAGVMTVAAAAQDGLELFIVNNRREIGQDVATAYTSGDMINAYKPVPGEKYQVRVAAETFAVGDKLTLGASGRLTKTIAAADITQAYFADTAGAYSAGDLAAVTWAGAGGTAIA